MSVTRRSSNSVPWSVSLPESGELAEAAEGTMDASRADPAVDQSKGVRAWRVDEPASLDPDS